jgi:hypothetical protein
VHHQDYSPCSGLSERAEHPDLNVVGDLDQQLAVVLTLETL